MAGGSTLQPWGTAEVAAPEEEEEDGMCFAARCGLTACSWTGGRGEGGVRSPAAGGVVSAAAWRLGF